MSSPKTLNIEFGVIVGREMNRHIKVVSADPKKLEVDKTTGQIREADEPKRPFVTLSIERIPVDDRSLTNRVRAVMQEQARQLAALVKQSGFPMAVLSLGGPKTEVAKRPDNQPGFLLTAWIDVLDEVGLLDRAMPVRHAADPT